MAEGALMTVLEHLGELRRRILRYAFVFLIALILCFHFAYEPIKYVILAPIEALNPNTTNVLARYNPLVSRLRPHFPVAASLAPVKLYVSTPMEKFMVPFNMALLGALVFTSPYLFYEMWAFIGAGLLQREKRFILRYLPLSLGLFVVGMLFAYFVALPIAMFYLLTLDPTIGLMLMYAPYLRLIVMIAVIFGLLFQLPLVMMALARMGVVTAKTMAHYWRHAIVINFILAALLTPSPEPFSQCLLAIPLCGLYGLGILLSKLVEKRQPQNA
jgi:sec-independent protein translocase protein TatC